MHRIITYMYMTYDVQVIMSVCIHSYNYSHGTPVVCIYIVYIRTSSGFDLVILWYIPPPTIWSCFCKDMRKLDSTLVQYRAVNCTRELQHMNYTVCSRQLRSCC